MRRGGETKQLKLQYLVPARVASFGCCTFFWVFWMVAAVAGGRWSRGEEVERRSTYVRKCGRE